MRYVIKRRYLRGAEVRFLAENGELTYRAREPFIGFTQDLTNAAGETVLAIRKLPLSLRKDFEVLRDGKVIATITKKTGMRLWYRVEMGGETAISIRPNYWATKFDFINSEGRIAVLSEPMLLQFFKPTELTIFDERQEEIVVAATVAVLNAPPTSDDNRL